jgi:hypothetical protein
VTNDVYDLLYTTDLALPISWQWILRTDPGQTNLVVSNAFDPQGFYRLGPPNDLVANDSLGTNFWVAFYNMDNSGVNLSLYISSPVAATGMVTIPGLNITNHFSVAAGGVTNVFIASSAMITNYDEIENGGIHITASQPVSVYGVDYSEYLSAAFTAYPTTLLGTNYCLMAHPESFSLAIIPPPNGNTYMPEGGGGSTYASQFAIVATANNTTVMITATNANLDGFLWTNAIILQEGQTYQIRSVGAYDDVTGTWITSDKPVAVFAGAADAYIPNNSPVNYFGGADNPLVQEQLPVNLWGTNALSMGFAGRTNGDNYRILAAYDYTMITITGLVVALQDTGYSVILTTTNEVVTVTNMAGRFYDIMVQGPVQFQANKPIQVAHFANGAGFDNSLGDPTEILLPPTGHYLQTNIFVTLTNDNVTGDFTTNFVNLIVMQAAITNTLVDDLHIATTNFVAIGTSGYYGAQVTLTNSGVHKVTSSQPVGVEIYGFGDTDAYGYFGGFTR